MINFYAERLAAKLLHRPVIHHLHVLALRLDCRWALLELLEVKRRHLLNINERLVI